jgi:hypothetical protein
MPPKRKQRSDARRDGRLRAALEYTEFGIHVFPLYGISPAGRCRCGDPECSSSPGKHPTVKWGTQATTDPTKIERLLRSSSREGLGAAVGNGFLVLDFDPKNEGLDSFAEIEKKHGAFPRTTKVLTGEYPEGRGIHLWLRTPPGVEVRSRPLEGHRGVDVKARGGYVVLPPTLHKSGVNYEVEVPFSEMADAPDWVLELLPQMVLGDSSWEPNPEFKMSREVKDFLNGDHEIETGEQRQFLCRAARSVLTTGRSVEETAALLFEGYGDGGISASPQDESDPWQEDEVLFIVEDEFSKPPTTPLEKTFGGGSGKKKRDRPSEMAVEAFHGLAGEFIGIVEPESEADPAALLVQFLVAAGSAMGRRPGFRVEADRHGTNLYAVVVGDSAKARKGTSWGQAQRPAVLADPSWEDRVRTGVSSGEGLMQLLRNDEPDGTSFKIQGEKTEGVRGGVDDRRLQLYEPEFAALLRRGQRSDNIVTAVLRDLWDRGQSATFTRQNPIQVTDAHVSLVTHITERELASEFTSVDMANGFGNRFLWICARKSKDLPFGGNLKDEDLDPIAKGLAKALVFAKDRAPAVYPFDRAAEQAWPEIYERLERPDPSLIGDVTSRATPNVRRLAVILAVLDRAKTVKQAHVDAAVAIWDYAHASAEYLFQSSSGNSTADAILKYAEDKGGEVSKSDIYRNLFSNNKSASEIDAALARLEDLGHMRRVQGKDAGNDTTAHSQKKGRPREIWQITETRSN